MLPLAKQMMIIRRSTLTTTTVPKKLAWGNDGSYNSSKSIKWCQPVNTIPFISSKCTWTRVSKGQIIHRRLGSELPNHQHNKLKITKEKRSRDTRTTKCKFYQITPQTNLVLEQMIQTTQKCTGIDVIYFLH